MRRREFITLLGGAAAWPLAVRAQEGSKVYKTGILSPAFFGISLTAFFDALRELGWIEGKNIVFERRQGENRVERLHEAAEELVRLKVDVIVALGTLGPLAAK
jgi:putative ABC transport system substrate-binding protein